MRRTFSQQESQETKWRRRRGGFVGGIALMACGEIINLINWRSRLLQCPLTTRVTKPTKTGTPVVGGSREPTTNCTPSLPPTSPSCFHAAANSRADDEVEKNGAFCPHVLGTQCSPGSGVNMRMPAPKQKASLLSQ